MIPLQKFTEDLDVNDRITFEKAATANIAAGKKSVRLAVSGYFTSSKNVDVGGDFSLPGFSVGTTIGNTITLMSETVNVAYDYTVN